jgi:hypothetical protein
MYPRGFKIGRMRVDEVAQQYTGNVEADVAGLAEGGPDQAGKPPTKPATRSVTPPAPATGANDDEVEDVGDTIAQPSRRTGTPPPAETDDEGEPLSEGEPPVETGEELEVEEEDAEPEPVKTSSYVKEVKAKYPNLFKEFPDLREHYFAAEHFREVFPTIEDAKEAHFQSELYQVMAGRILQGHSDQLIDSLVKENSLDEFADGFLPTLMEKAPKTYIKLSTNIISKALSQVAAEGEAMGNDTIRKAVRWVSQIIFGTPQVPGERAPDPKVKEERTNLQKEKDEFIKTKERDFDGRVKTEINRKLMEAALKNLDPQKKLSDFNRRALVSAMLQEVGAAGAKDPAFMRQMQSLWRRASQAGFSGEWEARIVSAYLARATNLLTPIRQRERKALGYDVPKPRPAEGEEAETSEIINQEREEQTPPQRRAAPPRSPAGNANVPNRGAVPNDPKKIDWKRTSDEDFLAGRVTLKQAARR